LDYANAAAALSLHRESGVARVGVATAAQWSGTVTLLLDGQAIWASESTVTPDAPFRADVSLPASAAPTSQFTLRCEDAIGNVVAEFTDPGDPCINGLPTQPDTDSGTDFTDNGHFSVYPCKNPCLAHLDATMQGSHPGEG